MFIDLLNSNPDFNKEVSLKHVMYLCSLFNTTNEYEKNSNAKLLFNKLDINSDGLLSINQFFKYSENVIYLFEPLYQFRTIFINYFYPKNSYRVILNRRKEINMIKIYRIYHDNDFPPPPKPQNCRESFKNFIRPAQNPYKYDYECDIEAIPYFELTKIIILKYNSNYNASNKKENFTMRRLDDHTEYTVITEINAYFAKYRAALFNKHFSSKENEHIEYSFSGSSLNRSKSILRNTKITPSNLKYKYHFSYNVSITPTHKLSHFTQGNPVEMSCDSCLNSSTYKKNSKENT